MHVLHSLRFRASLRAFSFHFSRLLCSQVANLPADTFKVVIQCTSKFIILTALSIAWLEKPTPVRWWPTFKIYLRNG